MVFFRPYVSAADSSSWPYSPLCALRLAGFFLEKLMNILSIERVTQKTSLGRTTVYAYMKDGRFPAAVHTGSRRVGWLESEIDAWLKARVEERATPKVSA